MDTNLPGYVLHALDDPERAEVEGLLARDPDAVAQALALRQVVAPLAFDAEAPEPPPRLVLDTLALVAEHACARLPEAPKPRLYQGDEEPMRRRWFRRPDVLVAAAVLVLAGGLLVPALVKGWHNYEIQSCKNNLRQFGGALQVYSDFHDGRFPRVEPEAGPEGLAGVVVPLLSGAGALDSIQVSVACPAVGRQPPPEVTLAELWALYQRNPTELEVTGRALLPGYAYSLGYKVGPGRYVGPHREQGEFVPLMADCPCLFEGNSMNHGGAGQNVLFSDGHVRWCTERTVGEDRDDIYLNDRGKVLAGLGRSDTVLGPSLARPVDPSDPSDRE